MLNNVSLSLISRGVSSTEFGDLENLCKAVMKEKQPFERLEVSKETLLRMFKVRGKIELIHPFLSRSSTWVIE